MKILNYKSRWHLIWDAIFKSINIKSRIVAQQDRVVQAAVDRTKNDLRHEFDRKLEQFYWNQVEKGIVHQDHEVKLLRVPVFGMDVSQYPTSTADYTTHEVETLRASFASTYTTRDQHERHGATKLAEELVKRGYVMCKFSSDGMHVEYYVNMF